MLSFANEPMISVGLMNEITKVSFALTGEYWLNGALLSPGWYEAFVEKGSITLRNQQNVRIAQSSKLHFVPQSIPNCSTTIMDLPIGRDFHWERFQKQKFQGEMFLNTFGNGKFSIINKIPLELYLKAVICSEINPQAPNEFLKAHCVISRSWVLAQLQKKRLGIKISPTEENSSWTDVSSHQHFDVCADDHCQRYHGIESVNTTVQSVLKETWGKVLLFNGEICDTRFSKCCGGITERFSTAWGDRDFSYLTPVPDCPANQQNFTPPVSVEADACRFICSRPNAYCNVTDKKLLSRILSDFDYETHDFFRWQVTLSQEELTDILLKKTNIAFGNIKQIQPLARGPSSRIYKLRVFGEKHEKIFGKELEIRRILSSSHLYSSAFVVEPFGNHKGIPEGFILKGAGWGHGVGLCQIGAAVMATQSYDYRKILDHYFTKAEIIALY